MTGQLVRSLQGGDRGHFYLVIGQEADRYYLWEGKRFRVGRWKKKNPRHLEVVCETKRSHRDLALEALHAGQTELPEDRREARKVTNRRLELDAQVRRVIKVEEEQEYGKRRCH